MFKLTHEGNVLLDLTSDTLADNKAQLLAAFSASEFAQFQIDHKSLDQYFEDADPPPFVVVAKKVDASISVNISQDKMTAHLVIVSAQGGKSISLEQAKKAIIEAGVTRGFNQASLTKLLTMQTTQEAGSQFEGVVARGRFPIDGQPSVLIKEATTLKDRLQKPKLKPDGSVDMRDFGKLASVAQGELLMTKKPPTSGTDGFDVTGEILSAKAGENLELSAGEGTQINQDNPLQLIASTSGVPVEIGNGMRVDNVFTISDVSIKSGHIDFDGSVVVTHNVEPGMKVTAKGDINVMGSVESGQLTAGGNISITQGVIGHQQTDNLSSRIIAKGTLQLSHAQYAYLEADNITISRQASHCQLNATGIIFVGQDESQTADGKLFGGKIINAQRVFAAEIGSDSGAKMQIQLAKQGDSLSEEISQLTETLATTDSQLHTLQQTLEKAEKIKDADKKQMLIAKITPTLLHLIEQSEQLSQSKACAEAHFDYLLSEAAINVTNKLNSGVEITIFDKATRTNRSYPPCKVSLEDGKVAINFTT